MRMKTTLWYVLVVLLVASAPLRLCAETDEHQSKEKQPDRPLGECKPRPMQG